MANHLIVMKKDFEKETDTAQSLFILENAVQEGGLDYKLSDYGATLKSSKCSLIDKESSEEFRGNCCASFLEKSQLGALGEAFQHYITFDSVRKNHQEKIIFKSINELNCRSLLMQQDILPSEMQSSPDKKHLWLEYQHLNGATAFYYPLALTHVHYAEFNFPKPAETISWRAHDTGMAIGCSLNEALLHGINEWIERDAYSLFLLKNIIKNRPDPIRFVDKKSLPSHFQQVIKEIEAIYQDDIDIVDIRTEINIPTFLVKFRRQKRLIQPSGMGASLSKECALEKALYESVQSAELYNEKAQQLAEDSIQHLTSTPLLLKALYCDLENASIENTHKFVSFDSIVDYSHIINIAKQVDFLLQILTSKGFSAFYYEYFKSRLGLYAVGVIIPGLEEFCLVKNGKAMFPKKRGEIALMLSENNYE